MGVSIGMAVSVGEGTGVGAEGALSSRGDVAVTAAATGWLIGVEAWAIDCGIVWLTVEY
jgi:hypothetical protein